MNAVALLETISRLQEQVLALEAEVVRLRKELADATQVRREGVSEHKGPP